MGAPAVAETPPRLLVVDDDQRLVSMLAEFLGRAGIEAQAAATLREARQRLQQGGRVDALVLDLMLPDGDGLAFTTELRADPRWRHLPLLMLTARGGADERVLGLELGADDYLPKPFEPRELLARLRALLRRAHPPATPATAAGLGAEEVLTVGDLRIDRGQRTVQVAGRECELTSHQFDLLWVLAEHAGRVMSRERIMDALRGEPLEAFDRSIDVHISRIRAAIEADPRDPKRLLTVRGVGYLLARAAG